MTPNCPFWYHLPSKLRWGYEAHGLVVQTLPFMYSVRLRIEGTLIEEGRVGMGSPAVMLSRYLASSITRRTNQLVPPSSLKSLDRRLS